MHWTRDSRPLASDSKCSIGRFGQVHRTTLQLNEEDMLLSYATYAKLQVAGARDLALYSCFRCHVMLLLTHMRICVAVLLSGYALQESAH